MGNVCLKTVSTVEAVCQALEQDILSSVFKPGEKITEAVLTQKYGVSRNTLREAITYLTADGVLERVANKGVYIKKITTEDVREIFLVRRMLELGAVEEIARRGILPGELGTALLRLEASDVNADWKEYVVADFEFHAALVDAAGSRRLSRLYHIIGKEVKLCIYQSWNVVALRDENVYHHRQILDYLQAGDGENAKAVLAEHLDAAVKGYELGFLRQHQGGKKP